MSVSAPGDTATVAAARPALSHQLVGAGMVSILGRLSARALDFVALLVLSRLLGPPDFGIVALAMSAVAIGEAVTQLPLSQVTLRAPDTTPAMLNTAFTLSILRAAVLVAAMAAIAVAMAWAYGDARLAPLVAALSLAPALRGLRSPSMVFYMRRMDFRREIASDFLGKAAATLIACAIALATRSYWAIAAATIAAPMASTLLSYVFAPYRPRLSLIEWARFRDVVGWNSASQIFATATWQADRLLLGGLLPHQALGRYTMATDLSGMAMQAFVVPLFNPIYAAYAQRAREGSARMIDIHLKASNAILVLVGPLLLGLAMLAKPVVALTLGADWSETGALLRWLALAYLPILPVANLGGFALAMGKPRIYTMRVAAEFFIAVPAMAAGGLLYGVWGVVAARLVVSVLVLAFGFLAVRTLSGCGLWRQAISLRRSVAALLALALALAALDPLTHGATAGVAARAVAIAAASAAGAVVYAATLLALWTLEGRPAGVERSLIDKIGALLRGR